MLSSRFYGRDGTVGSRATRIDETPLGRFLYIVFARVSGLRSKKNFSRRRGDFSRILLYQNLSGVYRSIEPESDAATGRLRSSFDDRVETARLTRTFKLRLQPEVNGD
jgi:hypothetical protein